MSIEKNNLPRAKYSADVDLNGFILSSSVLEDGTRIFAERSLANAFGIKGSGAFWQKKKEAKDESAFLPEYLSAKYLKPFISNELREKLDGAFSYIAKNGSIAKGVDATVLADICDVFIQAKNAKIKNANLLNVADAAYKMIKAFAKVGIIALIDEATGYQYEREKKELQVIFKELISDEILEWQQAFHLSFYKEIFRLWDIPFIEKNIKRKPQFIGHITNKFIYQNLPKGTFVLEKLKAKTPKSKGGGYKYRLHQSLTPEKGREALKKVIYSVEALASISDTKRQFIKNMNNKYGQKELPFTDLDEIDNIKETQPTKSIPQTEFDKGLLTLLRTPPMPKEKK